MPDKKVPANGVILAGEAVKYRHVVIVRQAVDAGLIVVGPRELTRIAACLEQKHAPPGLGEPRGQRPAARARPDDDVIECVSHRSRLPWRCRPLRSLVVRERATVSHKPRRARDYDAHRRPELK